MQFQSNIDVIATNCIYADSKGELEHLCQGRCKEESGSIATEQEKEGRKGSEEGIGTNFVQINTIIPSYSVLSYERNVKSPHVKINWVMTMFKYSVEQQK